MAVSDMWHRTLVYFGMADEADDYDDDYDEEVERRYERERDRQSPRARRPRAHRTASGPTCAASARAAAIRTSTTSSPTSPSAGAATGDALGGQRARSTAGGAPGGAQELQRRPADRGQVQGARPGHPQPPERRDRPRQAAHRLLQRAHLRPRRRHAARRRQGLHADPAATSRSRRRSGRACWRRASSTSTERSGQRRERLARPGRGSSGAGAMGRALAAGLVRGDRALAGRLRGGRRGPGGRRGRDRGRRRAPRLRGGGRGRRPGVPGGQAQGRPRGPGAGARRRCARGRWSSRSSRAGTSTASQAAIPGAGLARTMPNLAVRHGAGVVVLATRGLDDAVEAELLRVLRSLGDVDDAARVPLPGGHGPGGQRARAPRPGGRGARGGRRWRPASPARRPGELTAAVVAGTAALLADGTDPALLRQRVSSPAGTTIAGLAVLERGAVRAHVADAVRHGRAPRHRAVEHPGGSAPDLRQRPLHGVHHRDLHPHPAVVPAGRAGGRAGRGRSGTSSTRARSGSWASSGG